MNAQKFLIYTKLMRKFGNSDEKHTREIEYLKILYVSGPAELV